MTAKEFYDKLPAGTEILEDDASYSDMQYTKKELFRFAEAYAKYRIKQLNKD